MKGILWVALIVSVVAYATDYAEGGWSNMNLHALPWTIGVCAGLLSYFGREPGFFKNRALQALIYTVGFGGAAHYALRLIA